MAPAEKSFYRIIQDTWLTTLGLPVERLSRPEIPDAMPLIVSVKISGAWEGQVYLQCSAPLARLIAAVIFQIEAEKATSEEILDALSELVHIIGGNLKNLLPRPVELSLPMHFDSVIAIKHIPAEQVVCRLALQTGGYPFGVTLWENLPLANTGTLVGTNGTA